MSPSLSISTRKNISLHVPPQRCGREHLRWILVTEYCVVLYERNGFRIAYTGFASFLERVERR
jgi:hypothetical protein